MKSYSSREVIQMLKQTGGSSTACAEATINSSIPSKKDRDDQSAVRRHPADNAEKHRKAVRAEIQMISVHPLPSEKEAHDEKT